MTALPKIKTRRPSSKARRKLKRAPLLIPTTGARPVLIAATASGVESWVRAACAAHALACVGYYCAATTVAGPGLVATPTAHPAQALKWNVRAADATLLIAPNGPLFGRPRHAIEWCRRYRKRWLLLTPADFSEQTLIAWLRTRPPQTLHISGPLEHQALSVQALVARVMAVLAG